MHEHSDRVKEEHKFSHLKKVNNLELIHPFYINSKRVVITEHQQKVNKIQLYKSSEKFLIGKNNEMIKNYFIKFIDLLI